jgi:hypothetical protein
MRSDAARSVSVVARVVELVSVCPRLARTDFAQSSSAVHRAITSAEIDIDSHLNGPGVGYASHDKTPSPGPVVSDVHRTDAQHGS